MTIIGEKIDIIENSIDDEHEEKRKSSTYT